MTWSGNLTATFADRLQVSVTTRRGAFPTLLSDASYAVNRSLAASAEFALTDRISLGGGYTQTKQRFVGDVQGTLTALKRSKADSFSASANYRMNDRLRFSIFGRHQKRKSDLTLFDYKDTAYGAKVSFGI